MKNKSFGFKTPVRRETKNITGNKVGGELSGSECKIVFTRVLNIDDTNELTIKVNLDQAIGLFDGDIGIAAIGGYFLAQQNLEIHLEIQNADGNPLKYISKSFDLLDSNGISIEKLGIDYIFDLNKEDPASYFIFKFTFKSKNSFVDFIFLNAGFISSDYFIDHPELFPHYNNSKKNICIPEQFYFNSELNLPNTKTGNPIILKSCNRCQRFLPLNHFNERLSPSFSNHCVNKAPCTHNGFSKYEIVQSDLVEPELESFINHTVFRKDGKFLISYHGHQLECKACKKFFVNAALNNKRTSTQHREDALRRRAFEKLLAELSGNQWIYHKFKQQNQKEFDVYIWEKFDKKCFNCGKALLTPNDMDLDHTMPLAGLYPLDESATCLCPECNSRKHDAFPVDFYTNEQLINLSQITNIPLQQLLIKKSNPLMVSQLYKNIVWFFETFIIFEEYLKVRDGKTVADSIIHSLQKAINNSELSFNLKEEYEKLNTL
jgi:5-methylcytosine-specific restriction endonuclease McrA